MTLGDARTSDYRIRPRPRAGDLAEAMGLESLKRVKAPENEKAPKVGASSILCTCVATHIDLAAQAPSGHRTDCSERAICCTARASRQC
jgi:hypothetical protein